MGVKQKVTPDDAKRPELQRQALELRKTGLTYREIGKIVGVSAATACLWVKHALSADIAQNKVTADELRELQIQRLDKIIKNLFQQVDGEAGADAKLYTPLLKAIKQQSELQGLELAPIQKIAPVQIDAQGNETPYQPNITDYSALIEAVRNAGKPKPD